MAEGISDIARTFYSNYPPDYYQIRGDNTLIDLYNWQGTENILDIGSGGGYDCITLSNKAKNIIGIDITENMTLFSIKNNSADNIKYINEDFLIEPFKENQFDVIISNWSACHFKDKINFFKTVKYYLKPNGTFLIGDTRVDDENLLFQSFEDYISQLNLVFNKTEYFGEIELKNELGVVEFYRMQFKSTK